MLVYHEVSLSIIFLNVYKIGHRKTRKMLRLRVFGPPRLAPYRLGHGVRTLLMPYHF